MTNVNLDENIQNIRLFIILSYVYIYLWYTKYVLIWEVFMFSSVLCTCCLVIMLFGDTCYAPVYNAMCTFKFLFSRILLQFKIGVCALSTVHSAQCWRGQQMLQRYLETQKLLVIFFDRIVLISIKVYRFLSRTI